jgi:uncharacterized protein (TIGR00255 family)
MTAGGGRSWRAKRCGRRCAPRSAAALAELVATRRQEGEALAADIEAHRAQLAGLAAQLRRRRRRCPSKFARRLRERLARCAARRAFEPGRIAQEAALMAERLDVSEELVRLDTHLAHSASCSRARAPSGASWTSSSRRSAAS